MGNLSVGGTGKSPMVELLLGYLKNKYKVATLSRGYKRKTKGYALANDMTTALDIGDEPMQFHLNFPAIPVAVGEKRIEAIPRLLYDRPETEVIILDDAFQHRDIKAGLNILLTDCSNLFTGDFYLPAGELRDQKKSYKRAEVIVVTKCDPGLNNDERRKIFNKIRPLPQQTLLFTSIGYGVPYHLSGKDEVNINKDTEILLVTGIANPKPLVKMLEEQMVSYHIQSFSDHHIFTIDDLNKIKKKYEAIQASNKMILTTEKDAVRLLKFNNEIKDLPVYVLPVTHHFLFYEEEKFKAIILNYIQNFKQSL